MLIRCLFGCQVAILGKQKPILHQLKKEKKYNPHPSHDQIFNAVSQHPPLDAYGRTTHVIYQKLIVWANGGFIALDHHLEKSKWKSGINRNIIV